MGFYFNKEKSNNRKWEKYLKENDMFVEVLMTRNLHYLVVY